MKTFGSFDFLKKAAFALVVTAVLFAVGCKTGGENSPGVNYYTVTFNAGEGVSVPSQQVEEGYTAIEPGAPERSGFTFAGWYYYGKLWNFLSPVTGDMQLTAKWYDQSVSYRVSIGLRADFGDRGSVEIVGKNVNTAMFTEGTEVTVKATANEGYSFRGWSNYVTGEQITTEPSYTFTVVKNTVLEASFIYEVSGLDDEYNALLWKTLNETDISKGVTSFERTAGGVTEKYTLSYDLTAGKTYFEAQVGGRDYAYFIDMADEPKIYFIDGEIVSVTDIPKEVTDMLKPNATAADREQQLLAIYDLLRGRMYDDDGLKFTVDVGAFLRDLREVLEANADLTPLGIIYDTLGSSLETMSKIGSGLPGVPDMNNIMNGLTVGDFIKRFMLGEDKTMADFDADVNMMLGELERWLSGMGVEFDASSAYAGYGEIKAGTVKAFIDSLAGAESGSIGDMPENLDAAGKFAYAVLHNFTLEDFVKIAVEVSGIKGTDFDFTDPEVDLSWAIIPGEFFVENGYIVGGAIEYESEEGGEKVLYKLTFSSEEDPVFPSAEDLVIAD
ncbi:MAG: InlB B-repeat-containing protein [Clostridia bacterium]|nr:InlB B-repeat-containing protein [Clostridia bacterium]